MQTRQQRESWGCFSAKEAEQSGVPAGDALNWKG